MSLEEGKRTFFGDDVWQIVPWSASPESKTYTNRLLDIVSCIPAVIEDCDLLQMTKTETTRTPLRESIREGIVTLHRRLFDIRWQWELSHPNACHEVKMHGGTSQQLSVDDNGDPLFDSLLSYRDLVSAVEIGMYNTCLLLLREHAMAIGMNPDDDAITPDTTKQFTHKTNPALSFPHEIPGSSSLRSIAREICRSAEFYLKPVHGITGAFFLLFPLRVAQFVYGVDGNDQEARWIKKIMKYIGDQYGFGIAYEYC
jgi:hypothetical protein